MGIQVVSTPGIQASDENTTGIQVSEQRWGIPLSAESWISRQRRHWGFRVATHRPATTARKRERKVGVQQSDDRLGFSHLTARTGGPAGETQQESTKTSDDNGRAGRAPAVSIEDRCTKSRGSASRNTAQHGKPLGDISGVSRARAAEKVASPQQHSSVKATAPRTANSTTRLESRVSVVQTRRQRFY